MRQLEVGKAYEWKEWIFAVVSDDGGMYTVLTLLAPDELWEWIPPPGALYRLHAASQVAHYAELK